MNEVYEKIKSSRGTALLMTILILNAIVMVSLAAAQLVSSGVQMSGTQSRSTKSFFAAESGAERALWEWRQNGWIIPSGSDGASNLFSSELLNSSSYQVDKATSSSAILRSNGIFNNLQRTVELELIF
jgi:Tfp pilus assembly protein PilX